MERTAGLEPAAPDLASRRSGHLSYVRVTNGWFRVEESNPGSLVQSQRSYQLETNPEVVLTDRLGEVDSPR